MPHTGISDVPCACTAVRPSMTSINFGTLMRSRVRSVGRVASEPAAEPSAV